METVWARAGGESVDPVADVDVVQIMRQIREQASRQRQKFALSSAASPPRNRQMAEDLGFLQSSQDIAQAHISSHRKIVGDLIVFAKKLLQHLLSQVFERQSAYNAVNARLMASLCERVERMEAQVASALEAVRAEETAFLDALRQTITGQLEALSHQQGEALQALQTEVARQSRERRAQARHLTQLVDEVRRRLSEPRPQESRQPPAREDARPSDAFFAAFDEQFRGTRAATKERLRVYLPLLQEANIGAGDNPVVDLGCGRGEWLELLQEEGIQGKGVDRNCVLAEECRQSGLDVVESDLLTYLCSLPDSSIGGVTGFHIVEHLPFDLLLTVFDETVRVLQPDGIAIFETPNPQNVLVSTEEFYIDPTHRHPLPSSLLKFVAEVKGLSRVKVLYLHPFPEAHRVQEAGLEIAQRFNQLFYGPRDYAVIGRKV
jgi:SAM-dependent methyltransferase